MSRRPLFVLALLALLAPARADDDVEKLPLWQAARDGLVEVSGQSVNEFRVTLVTIKSRSKKILRLDVLGSYFQPDLIEVNQTRSGLPPTVVTRDWIQPIGLGLLKPGDPGSEVTVSAGARLETRVLSFCLERHAGVPDEKTPLHFMNEPMPKKLLAILEAWRKEPKKRQEDVQKEIWDEGFPGKDAMRDLPAGATRIVVADHDVYALVGQLLWKGVPGEALVPFAYPVLDVASNGRDVFGLFATSPDPKTKQPGPFIARYCGHDRWGELVPATGVAKLHWARNGAILFSDESGALKAILKKEVREFGKEATFALDEARAVIATHDGTSSTLTTLDPHDLRLNATTRTVAHVVSSVAVDEAKTWIVTEKGELLSFEGKEKLERVGLEAKCRAVHAELGSAVVVTDGGLVLIDHAGDQLRLAAPPKNARILSSGGRIYAVSGAELWSFNNVDSPWEPLRFP